MDELLKKLLAAEILTEDTKTELEDAFKKSLNEAIETAREDATASVTAELNEQWITERDTLIEALDAKVTEALASEIAELKEDIERFRDLETEYAEKLVESKAQMAKTLKKDLAQLIEKMDAFLEIRLSAELEELREDLDVVKRNQFGKQIFEAFVDEFKHYYAGDDSVESRLHETEMRLEDSIQALEQAERKSARLERKIKLENVLAPLAGRSREVMEAILKNVDTPLLEEAYKTYIGRVLHETSGEEKITSEKENSVLAEGKKEKREIKGTIKNGDDKERIVRESVQDQKDHERAATFSKEERDRLQRIAGINMID